MDPIQGQHLYISLTTSGGVAAIRGRQQHEGGILLNEIIMVYSTYVGALLNEWHYQLWTALHVVPPDFMIYHTLLKQPLKTQALNFAGIKK